MRYILKLFSFKVILLVIFCPHLYSYSEYSLRRELEPFANAIRNMDKEGAQRFVESYDGPISDEDRHALSSITDSTVDEKVGEGLDYSMMCSDIGYHLLPVPAACFGVSAIFYIAYEWYRKREPDLPEQEWLRNFVIGSGTVTAICLAMNLGGNFLHKRKENREGQIRHIRSLLYPFEERKEFERNG